MILNHYGFIGSVLSILILRDLRVYIYQGFENQT